MTKKSLQQNNVNSKWIEPDSIPKSPEEAEEKYDTISADYDNLVKADGYQAPAEAAKILANLITKNTGILDAGCGTGLVGLELNRYGFKDITGMDISHNVLKEAETKVVYKNFVKGNLLSPLEFLDNHFGAVICIGVFSRFNTEQIIMILNEFSRITAQNGVIVFSHREDLMESSDLVVKLKEHKGVAIEHITSALPYLPNSVAGYENIGVHYLILRNG